MVRTDRKSIRRLAARASSARGRKAYWPAIVLAFFALTIQSFAVQTHIHGQLPAGTAYVDAAQSDGLATDGQDTVHAWYTGDHSNDGTGHVPGKQDKNECPLCQSAHQNGHYLKPAAASFALPHLANYRIIERATPASVYEAVSHSWQGRAPPQV